MLWLPDGEALSEFKMLTERKGKTAGQILACVITTVDYEPTSDIVAPVQKGGELAKLAGMFINNPDFQAWVFRGTGLEDYGVQDADEYIKKMCGIKSKRELDHNPRAAGIFHEQIRKPFSAWQEGMK